MGTAIDVAPAGFAHPVYRSGIALSLLVPPPKPQSEDRRAIEEIVPPELEATPFPMPPALVEEPVIEESAIEPAIDDPELEPGTEVVPAEDSAPESEVSPSAPHSVGEALLDVPNEPPIAEPEPELEEPPLDEPDLDPIPIEEPEAEPEPIGEPEAETEPIIEVAPQDSASEPKNPQPAPAEDGGHEI
jgi:hypothetical protein